MHLKESIKLLKSDKGRQDLGKYTKSELISIINNLVETMANTVSLLEKIRPKKQKKNSSNLKSIN